MVPEVRQADQRPLRGAFSHVNLMKFNIIIIFFASTTYLTHFDDEIAFKALFSSLDEVLPSLFFVF